MKEREVLSLAFLKKRRLPISGWSRLEHGHNARLIQIACRDAFEMRTDAAQFRSHETVHEMQTPVEPREQFVLHLVVNLEGDLRAVCTNLSEINNPHKGNVASRRFERISRRRVSLYRRKD